MCVEGNEVDAKRDKTKGECDKESCTVQFPKPHTGYTKIKLGTTTDRRFTVFARDEPRAKFLVS